MRFYWGHWGHPYEVLQIVGLWWVKPKFYCGQHWGHQGQNNEKYKLMLKIKIPPRSEQKETDQQPVTEATTPTAEFWAWWQRGFDEPEDLMEFDVGDFQTAVQLSSVVENYVWPDFKVGVEGTWVVFRRVNEKYYPRKKNKQSVLVNAA